MFENIIGQQVACDQLSMDASGGSLPGSLLFAGPATSAKASTALELARVLSCTKGARWNCSCDSCTKHRLIVHPDILMTGPKAFHTELLTAHAMLSRSPGMPARYFFVRAVRKLQKRFDQNLYRGEEGRLAKVAPLMLTLMESIDACAPDSGVSDEDVAAIAGKLVPVCMKLEESVASSTPVYQIRALEYWARLSPHGKRKIILIEHADRMLDAARNALLKILEEPPPLATFVLTTTRPQAMIQTVLSRVRKYTFMQRNSAESDTVLSRIFRDDVSGVDVGSYLARFDTHSKNAMHDAARTLVAALLAAVDTIGTGLTETPLLGYMKGSTDPGTAIASAMTATGNFGGSDASGEFVFRDFMDACMGCFAGLTRSNGAGPETDRLASRFAALARDAIQKNDSFNMQAGALVERLADAFIYDEMNRSGRQAGPKNATIRQAAGI